MTSKKKCLNCGLIIEAPWGHELLAAHQAKHGEKDFLGYVEEGSPEYREEVE